VNKSTINGVASAEKVSNSLGGKQSKLDYRFDLIDAKAMFALANVLHLGEVEYGKDNWRKIDGDSHLNHALSHIYAYLAGDKQDDHLSHALCRTMMALAVEVQDAGKLEVRKSEVKCRQCLYAAMTNAELAKLGTDPCDTCNDLRNWKPKEA